ncbi:MAG: winged helix DNA-binding protein [Treponema sp.]|jgi:DNA-binding MarR family transcriptional regulator|nr:winged helix DNA-binding protein [Treponema sp.]
MDDELKEDLLHSLFCFKKAMIAISRFLSNADAGGISAAELSALNCIGRCGEADGETALPPAERTAHHTMHEKLAISKAAVSQMLGSLEKRGFIQRETYRDNRRKIIITVTEKGKSAVDTSGKNMDALLSRIITGFGEQDARRFVQLLDRFTELVDESVGKTD